MKLLNYTKERKGGDKMLVSASWRTRMRQPGGVSITHTTLDPRTTPVSNQSVLLEGEGVDVYDTLSGLAQIAWDMGWRPAGLMGGLARYIQDYKPTPE